MRLLVFFIILPLILPVARSQTGSKTRPRPRPPTASPGKNPINFSDVRLAAVYPVIQSFKATITADPLNVTATWVGPDVCSYRGFICDNPPYNASATALAGIDFNGFGLAAPTLHGFINRLPDLGIFHANSNDFSGVLHPSLAALPYLFELDLSNNLFTGAFPFAVLNAGLSFLDLRYNLFTGAIPKQVLGLGLDALFLNNNLFVARIPESLGATPAEFLTFANNMLVGPIPSSIGNLNSTLSEVLFLNNLLSGCVPFEVGLLTRSTVFDASNNQLTGTLPSSLACLQSVEVISFAQNQLFGVVPEVLCSGLGSRPSLVNFTLSDNYFSGVGAECMKLYRKGVLDLSRNCVPNLTDQRSAIECMVFRPPAIKCPSRDVVPCQPPTGNRGRRKNPPRRGLRAAEPSVTYAALSREGRKR